MQVVNKLPLPWELYFILKKDKREEKKIHTFELLLLLSKLQENW